MTALQNPTRHLNTTQFDVYTRRVRSGAPPELGLLGDDAEGAGWVLDNELLFRRLRFATWPNSGYAQLTYIPLSGTFEPIEQNIVNRYWVDDQVRIEMFPPSFSGGAPIGAGTGTAGGDPDQNGAPSDLTSGGVVLFEGVLARQHFGVRATGDRDDEDTGLVAIDGPTIDNLDFEHFVRGRWVQDPGEEAGTPFLIDGHDVPAVFNAGGQPNMMPMLPMTAHDGGIGLEAKLFTFDADWRAEYWTVRDALVSILAMWLFGHSTAEGTAKPRSATLETLTAQALLDDTQNDGRWAGLDALLPETNVQDLGVYDAFHRVCQAGGFEMSVTPPLGRVAAEVEDAAVADRLYHVRLWRSGAGPLGSVKLQPRPEHDAASLSAADELGTNNVDQLTGLVDTTRTRNHVMATGAVVIETTVELKPMWSPADEYDGSIVRRLQLMVLGNTSETYNNRHVLTGPDLGDYGHVGRRWGLDCTGQFAELGLGYTEGPYAHPADGFDWLTALGIDGSDALSLERAANGVTDPIRWARRSRPALPLARPSLLAANRRYILEVSEDGGDNWTELPNKQFKVEVDRFEIELTYIPNLASVNANTYVGGGSPAAVDESWWALMKSGDLRFRLTCRVPADHSQRFDATRPKGAGTLYNKVMRVRSGTVTNWSAPSSILNTGSAFERIDAGGYGASTAGPNHAQNIQDLAERVRDARSLIRLALSGGTWIMDPALFQVGDRVGSIEGRNLPLLQTSPGGEQRSPSIVGVTITGALEGGQGISFDVADETMRRGV